MSRQYVIAKFRPEDRRTYTWHNDGEPVAIGDRVKVAGRHGSGWQGVHVVDVTDAEPDFDTKPILGKIEPDQGDLAVA